ncbi:MAG: hypothetical protein JWP18_1562, partial [Solirubrobacterales bacterium]|nr:hypothetical protein [Solirubrobacterales bacterium]
PPREVVAWRRARLRDAGSRGPLAERLARDTRYDLHALTTCTPCWTSSTAAVPPIWPPGS